MRDTRYAIRLQPPASSLQPPASSLPQDAQDSITVSLIAYRVGNLSHMTRTIDILLLLALPASGKSEVRRYLEHVAADTAEADFLLRPTIQVDDYPYVHLMRRISEEQTAAGLEPTFFRSPDSPFVEPADWLTLIYLVAEDVGGLGRLDEHDPDPQALLHRLDRARARAGLTTAVPQSRDRVAAAIAQDAAELASSLPVVDAEQAASSSVVIEFARGGPEGASMPLDPPLGYRHSLAALDPGILERAAILYVWVTPQESRRRNRDRALPGRDGDASILHHGVPESVMRNDYGTDDIEWLETTSPVPGTIAVDRGDLGRYRVPIARLDNRTDLTSFLRADPDQWPPGAVDTLHGALKRSFGVLGERLNLR
jgi:hypothetical protein